MTALTAAAMAEVAGPHRLATALLPCRDPLHGDCHADICLRRADGSVYHTAPTPNSPDTGPAAGGTTIRGQRTGCGRAHRQSATALVRSLLLQADVQGAAVIANSRNTTVASMYRRLGFKPIAGHHRMLVAAHGELSYVVTP